MFGSTQNAGSWVAGLTMVFSSIAIAGDDRCEGSTDADILAEVRAKYEASYKEWVDSYQEQYDLELQEQRRQNLQYSAQLSESERLLELQSEVLSTAENNEQRFSEVLARWEVLQQRYERYLESLEKNLPEPQ